MRNVLLFALTSFAATLCLGADVYPSRTVRFIAPGVPGNSSDIIGRILSKQLTQRPNEKFFEHAESRVSGAVMRNFGPTQLRQMPISVPPLATQQAIRIFLSGTWAWRQSLWRERCW